MVALPVSGLDVTLRRPAGAEDVLLREAPRRDMRLSLALLDRLATAGAAIAWEELPVTDVEALLLELRRLVFGEVVRGTSVCQSERCGMKVDVEFRIGDYLAHHAPRPSRDAEPAGPEGWFTLRNAGVSFRLPVAGDRVAIAGMPRPDQALLERCVRPPALPARLLGRVARVMESLAPSLADVVEGTCPACGEHLRVDFDPVDFTLRELRDDAAFVFEEIHLLASRYHWPEPAILALPRTRRMQYVDMIHRDEGSA